MRGQRESPARDGENLGKDQATSTPPEHTRHSIDGEDSLSPSPSKLYRPRPLGRLLVNLFSSRGASREVDALSGELKTRLTALAGVQEGSTPSSTASTGRMSRRGANGGPLGGPQPYPHHNARGRWTKRWPFFLLAVFVLFFFWDSLPGRSGGPRQDPALGLKIAKSGGIKKETRWKGAGGWGPGPGQQEDRWDVVANNAGELEEREDDMNFLGQGSEGYEFDKERHGLYGGASPDWDTGIVGMGRYLGKLPLVKNPAAAPAQPLDPASAAGKDTTADEESAALQVMSEQQEREFLWGRIYGAYGGSMEKSALQIEIEGVLRKHPLVVFSKLECPYSQRAKALLKSYRLRPEPYIIELDHRPDHTTLKALLDRITQHHTFPNIILGGRSIGGSDDLERMDKSEPPLSSLPQSMQAQGYIPKGLSMLALRIGELRVHIGDAARRLPVTEVLKGRAEEARVEEERRVIEENRRRIKEAARINDEEKRRQAEDAAKAAAAAAGAGAQVGGGEE